MGLAGLCEVGVSEAFTLISANFGKKLTSAGNLRAADSTAVMVSLLVVATLVTELVVGHGCVLPRGVAW